MAFVVDNLSVTIFEASEFRFNVINIWWRGFRRVGLTIGRVDTAWNEFGKDKSILEPDLGPVLQVIFTVFVPKGQIISQKHSKSVVTSNRLL